MSPVLQDISRFGNATIAGANLMEGEDATVNACRESCCYFPDVKICRPVSFAALSSLVEAEQRKEL